MIKKIRVMLEYHCYPVWLYDEDGDIVDTLLPEELRDDKALDQRFDDLQSRYDALFIDNAHDFTYVGFTTDEQKQCFLADWDEAVAELEKKLNGKYPIVDDIGLAFKG